MSPSFLEANLFKRLLVVQLKLFFSVTKLAKSFLMKIEEEPLFHIDEINPTLYNAVPDLNEVKVSTVV